MLSVQLAHVAHRAVLLVSGWQGAHSPDLPGSRGQASRRAPAGCTDSRERSPPGAASPITFRICWDRRIDRPVARFVARRTRGRGCNQGYDGRWSAAFLQVAAPGRWAGLLIIRRSWVRVPAAPPNPQPTHPGLLRSVHRGWLTGRPAAVIWNRTRTCSTRLDLRRSGRCQRFRQPLVLVSPRAVSNVQDQDDEPVFLDFVQDAPGARSYSPRVRITHELSGLSRTWIFRQPVNDTSGLSPDSLI